jgi:hypothetical protein
MVRVFFSGYNNDGKTRVRDIRTGGCISFLTIETRKIIPLRSKSSPPYIKIHFMCFVLSDSVIRVALHRLERTLPKVA